MIPANIEKFGRLDQLPYVWLLQMVQLVFICGSKMCAQATVLACDDDAASSCRLHVVDPVLGVDTGFRTGFFQDTAVLVTPDATNVHHRFRRQHVLSSSGSVLRSAAGDELGVVVLYQVFVQAHVLFFGEDGVVGFEAILVKQSLITGKEMSIVRLQGLESKKEQYPTPWMSGCGMSASRYLVTVSGGGAEVCT